MAMITIPFAVDRAGFCMLLRWLKGKTGQRNAMLIQQQQSTALVLLKKIGIFASALIKKRHYWPFLIPGGAIAFHLKGRQVGSTELLYGVL
eukprot:4312284-Ditylum_brightwellii.AAC.1